MTTLAQLKTSVDSWLARDDVAVTGGDFNEIMLIAESFIARDVRLATQEATADLVFTGRSADLPSDFLEVRNPFVDDTARLFEYMTPQALRESRAWNNGRAGSFYTIEGNNTSPITSSATLQMTIAGPASASTPTTVKINYWARLPALVNGTDTNWLLTNHYDIYLYALLRVAAEYVQDDMLEDRFTAKYLDAVEKQSKHENR